MKINTINTLSISSNRQSTITKNLSTPILFKHPNTTKALNIASKLLLVSIIGMVLITILFLVCHHHILQYVTHNITNIHNFIDIMYITISISIVINIITQILFDKIALQIDSSTTLYKNAMAIIIGQRRHVLALNKKREPKEEQLGVENTFNELIELLTINVNTDKIAHLTLYDNIDALLVDFELQDLSPITTRMYLWIFQQRFLHLYNNHRVINNEYIQQCYKDDHLLISILLPIFNNSNDYGFFNKHHSHIQLLLNKISKNLLSLLIEFDKLLANQNIMIIMDEAVLQQYTLSIADIPNEQPTYLQNINLVLPSIGFKSQVCKTEYPPLYNDVLPDHCIDIETCMMHVSRLWQYAEETKKQHLLKKYKSINTSNNSSFAFTYNQKVWKFALVEDDEIGSMNYMVFNCIKMLISSHDSYYNTKELDNAFFCYWSHYLREHLQKNDIYFKQDIVHQIIHIVFFYYRNKFIELLCTDNPEPLKIREIFSFDKVSPKKPYLGECSIASPPQFLRLDEYCLPLLVAINSIEKSSLCFLNFDKFFCGLILAFDELLHQNAVCFVKEFTITEIINTAMYTPPRGVVHDYHPSATEILLYNAIRMHSNLILPFFSNDNKLFAHIKGEDRIVLLFKTEVRQLIYIGKTHNCRSIFNEMKKILTLTEQDYTDNPVKIRSLILYQLLMRHNSTEKQCFNIMKICITHIHKAIFYLCNKNATYYGADDLQYADFYNPIIIEVLQHTREIELHNINDFNNKIYPAIFNLLYNFHKCVNYIY